MDIRYRTYASISRGEATTEEQRIISRIRRRYPMLKRVPKENADLLIVFGGDGTLLDVIRERSARNPDILAFHCGTVGFLPTVREPARFDVALDKALAGLLERMPIPLIRVAYAHGIRRTVHFAVNDVTIECPMTWLSLRIGAARGDSWYKDVRGAGLCVCSAIGSTSPLAAHLDAPPIDPALRALFIRGINDMQRPIRGLVVSGDKGIRATLTSISPNPGIPEIVRRDPTIFVDGLYAGIMSEGDAVEITYLKRPSIVLRLPEDGHWSRVSKL